MVERKVISLAIATMCALAVPVGAHSPEDVAKELSTREKYFQPLQKPAPSFTLRDAGGRGVSLADLRGKVVVLHFVYTKCPDACPLHAERIAEVQRMVNRTPMRSQVWFVTITTDPTRDTPSVMRGYGPAHGLDRSNWVFLTTGPGQPEQATRRLAQRFGHKFKKGRNNYQLHSIVTHVIDTQGRWRGNFYGLRFDPTNVVLFVNGLLNDHHRPQGPRKRNLWEWILEAF